MGDRTRPGERRDEQHAERQEDRDVALRRRRVVEPARETGPHQRGDGRERHEGAEEPEGEGVPGQEGEGPHHHAVHRERARPHGPESTPPPAAIRPRARGWSARSHRRP